MSDARAAAYAARTVRGLVFSLFVGGAIAAVAAKLFVVAGGAFLVGYTVLAAAVVHGQRRRGLGLSLAGLGWFLTALGVSVGLSTPTGTPTFAAGVTLLLVGTAALVRPLERLGIGTSA